jgi:hypothetical protein
MYYITDMSAMQTKNKKIMKFFLLTFWPQKHGKTRKSSHPAPIAYTLKGTFLVNWLSDQQYNWCGIPQF